MTQVSYLDLERPLMIPEVLGSMSKPYDPGEEGSFVDIYEPFCELRVLESGTEFIYSTGKYWVVESQNELRSIPYIEKRDKSDMKVFTHLFQDEIFEEFFLGAIIELSPDPKANYPHVFQVGLLHDSGGFAWIGVSPLGDWIPIELEDEPEATQAA